MGRAKNIPERDVLLLPFQARWVNDPARLKIMELDGLSEALRQDSETSGPAGTPMTPVQQHLLEVCSYTVGSLLDAIGEMFPLVRGILRSTQDAIDVARS